MHEHDHLSGYEAGELGPEQTLSGEHTHTAQQDESPFRPEEPSQFGQNTPVESFAPPAHENDAPIARLGDAQLPNAAAGEPHTVDAAFAAMRTAFEATRTAAAPTATSGPGSPLPPVIQHPDSSPRTTEHDETGESNKPVPMQVADQQVKMLDEGKISVDEFAKAASDAAESSHEANKAIINNMRV